MSDAKAYRRAEIQDVLDAGPHDDEDWFRLQVRGKHASKHLNITPDQLVAIQRILAGDTAVFMAGDRVRVRVNPTLADSGFVGATGIVIMTPVRVKLDKKYMVAEGDDEWTREYDPLAIERIEPEV